MGYRKPYYDEDHKLRRYGIRDALSDIFIFFKRFFAFRNIKHAFLSVVRGFREYIFFFAALLLVQCIFFTLWFNADSKANAVKEEAYSGCSYHLLIEGFTQNEWIQAQNNSLLIANERTPEERGYQSYTAEAYYEGAGEVRYRVRMILNRDSIDACTEILQRYKLVGENVHVKYGERVKYTDTVKEIRSRAGIQSVWIGVLAAVILVMLFYIRTNQNKFLYGVYMAFGADFEKLLETGAWELLSISVITLVPAALLSWGVTAAIYASTGATAVLLPKRFLLGLLWTLAVVIAAVIPSVKLLSVKTPMSLIIAGDNSNYVSSPRVSFRIFGKSFPYHYELYGFWRYRQYYAMLLCAAVLFTTMFSVGLFVADMRRTEESFDNPQIIASLDSGSVDVLDIEAIQDLDGVRAVTWEDSVSATEKSSIALLTKKQASGISGKTVETDGMYADNNFRYLSVPENLYETVTEGLWETEGDLGKIYAGSYCAVSCSINNRECMHFKVGDTIKIGVFRVAGSPISYDKPDRKYILSQLVKNAYFTYYELEIAAIIDTGDTSSEYTVAVAPELFETLTGKEAEINNISVYLEEPDDHEAAAYIRDETVEIMASYGVTYTVTDTGADYEYGVSERISSYEPVLAGSAAVLMITPLVWFYSQSAFGGKRRKETYMLSAFGATDTDLSHLYLFSGAVLAALACVFTALFGSLLNYIIYRIINVFLPSLGFGEGIRYTYRFSFAGLLINVLVSCAGALASTYIPFVRYKRERDRIARVSSGEER